MVKGDSGNTGDGGPAGDSGGSGSTTAHGAWASPISAQSVAAGGKPLYAPRVDGTRVYWLEGLAAEGGRMVLTGGEPPRAFSPAGFNLRSRVHEYGGGACIVVAGTAYFSNFSDNGVYAQPLDTAQDAAPAAPRALTGDSRLRHADFALDARRQRLIAVREDHSQAGAEARNSLVALPLAGPGAGPAGTDTATELASGFDFYAAPRLSPDGTQLAWLCWRHPQMPWNGTELWLAELYEAGVPSQARKLAGGPTESLCQPLWSPGGELYVVSDRSEWWNLYRVETGPGPATLHPVCPMEAEFGEPQWVFGQAMYGFHGEHEIIATCIVQGMSRLGRIDLRSGAWTEIATPYSSFDDLQVGPGFVVALAGSPEEPQQLVRIALPAEVGAEAPAAAITVLARSVQALPDTRFISRPRAIEFPSTGGRIAHAFYYPPTHPDHPEPKAGDPPPPLIVTSHGGPTALSTTTLRLSLQYWTSRGFAVLDVNYGGSTGYGRPYRELLAGTWGVVDVEDCVEGARFVAAQGLADPQRMAIRGSSASGFTTLAALTFHDLFKAGASYYGVTDLAALDADTHKFESRYTAWLVAPPEHAARVYAERSPREHIARLRSPMIFFQGLDDKVVPPAQAELLVQAMRASGVPVAYLSFEGEGHGFRQQATIRRTLEAELSFYGQVFGFEPAGGIPPVEIRRGG